MGPSLFQIGKCLVIGHRGAPVSAHENTLEAFHHAIAGAADGVELDVRVTNDMQLVVHHDAVAVDTESSVLPTQSVATSSSEQSSEIVIATTDGDLLPPWLPRLDSVLDHLSALADQRARPSILVNVEIKSVPEEPHFDSDRGAARLVVDLLAARAERHLEFVVSSFDSVMLDVVRDHARRVNGENWLPTAQLALHATVGTIDAAAAAGHTAINPWWPMVTDEFVRHAHDRHMTVVPWTCDSPNDQDRLRDLGVDGVITNDPAGLAKRWAG